MKKKKIFAVIAAYNEEKTISEVLEELKEYVDQIVVVDDGSSDETFKKATGPKVILLRHLANLGQGAALQTGFEYAKRNKADIVITYDADGQFLACDIPRLIKPILQNKADIVLGSRFLGQAINIPPTRLLTLKLGIIFTFLFSGLKLTDVYNGLRALNSKSLHKINITQNRLAHASEILDKIKINQLRFTEIPVTVKYTDYSKQKGEKNLNALKVFVDLVTKKLY
ncbi:MAG: hypothetical protein UU73_C0001G0146 [Candidatus Daviesbacteria bacterium GW2011_GWA1_41_61]|uniref:Glycosyltransferase 2-like domain-containing protein n=1 Tax=Candidatus Daviesbacteria bacterium GW2011_GWA2_40_9 TaxID=1618424 RepID=A0A0G0WFH0_9BACT|nr:MAG: hypothetical protein UU26_C0001G0019 [Candidatus Daviesbacteria bacterium GW2011_GWC1_40_9]KKR83040.1 MAG: hypothetical protein UU29_C0008G0149 [Candidatus Daviesbacteria bacterium GW2011_GWA2_40_9]KKR92965.1 MAG: hypothetical protein UU44_C0004G0147 [Candidatus Daviesbacteria bacterium GW2011_GWB1_41_15]KKS15509.1 MAG: hypothetical protein UU73_C0001G0146 [Candidatus Daviesbacteria bacterium GW2011_GWA1_41_61]